MTDTEELKNCPFCCAKASKGRCVKEYFVECTVCPAEIRANSLKEAITLWNSRVAKE